MFLNEKSLVGSSEELFILHFERKFVFVGVSMQCCKEYLSLSGSHRHKMCTINIFKKASCCGFSKGDEDTQKAMLQFW